MSLYLSSFIVGFTAAALPGAVQTTLLQSSALGNVRIVFKLALGAALMDGLFLFLAYFGLVQFIDTNYWLKIIVTLLGTVYIGYLGLQGVISSIQKKPSLPLAKPSFWSGVLIVLLHPPTIFYFVGVSTELLFGVKNNLTVFVGSLVLSLGALTCFSLVIGLGHLIQRTGKVVFIKMINLLASLILIFFAFKLLFTLF